MLWGPELIQFYNDRCVPILAAKHPRSMGQRALDCWSEIWDVISPMYQSVLAGGSTMIKEADQPRCQLPVELLRRQLFEEAR